MSELIITICKRGFFVEIPSRLAETLRLNDMFTSACSALVSGVYNCASEGKDAFLFGPQWCFISYAPPSCTA